MEHHEKRRGKIGGQSAGDHLDRIESARGTARHNDVSFFAAVSVHKLLHRLGTRTQVSPFQWLLQSSCLWRAVARGTEHPGIESIRITQRETYACVPNRSKPVSE